MNQTPELGRNAQADALCTKKPGTLHQPAMNPSGSLELEFELSALEPLESTLVEKPRTRAIRLRSFLSAIHKRLTARAS